MKSSIKALFSTDILSKRAHITFLVYRILLAFAIIRVHGYKKLVHFEAEVLHIPDPFGFGGQAAVVMAILSNVVCAVLVALGLLTRLAALGALIVPLTGLLIVHLNDPWIQKDAPLMYSLAFSLILFIGPGKYSLDRLIYQRVLGTST
ncbi:MAG: DoxX family protein [Thermonemataceae bacterium]